MPETLGQRLRELRIADPYIKLRELAAALGASPRWLSDVETDRVKPTAVGLADIALALGVEVDDLIPLWNDWTKAPAPDYSASICQGRRA